METESIEKAGDGSADNAVQPADWAAIEAEYVNTSLSLTAIAEKYGVSKSLVSKKSAKGKWSAKRARLRRDKAEKVTEKLHGADVKKTLKSIEKCCRAADKLLEKINKAINQVDKQVYVSCDEREDRQRTEQEGDEEVTYSVHKRKMKTKRIDGLIDTRKLSDIAKSILNVKQILTGEDGRAETGQGGGLIEIAAACVIDSREGEDEEGSVEPSAEAGGDDVEA